MTIAGVEIEIVVAIVGVGIAFISLLGAFLKYRSDQKNEKEERLKKEFELNEKVKDASAKVQELEKRIIDIENKFVSKDDFRELKELIHELRLDIKNIYKGGIHERDN